MKAQKFLWLLIVLLMATTTVYSQGRRSARSFGNGNYYCPGTCLSVLTGLTEEQKAKITELEVSHQANMAELRLERRSFRNLEEKDAVRIEMLQKVEDHRNEVRKVLTEEQIKQYDLLHSQNNYRGRRYFGRRGAGGWQGGPGFSGNRSRW